MSGKLRLTAILLAAVLVMALPVSAYITQKDLLPGIVQIRWASAQGIAYNINPAQGANITGTRTLEQVFISSIAAWQGVTTATVTFTRGADTASTDSYTRADSPADSVHILKANLSPAEYQSVAGDALGLTLTRYNGNGEITDSDIIFNPTTLFSTSPTPAADRIDFESVATHEIGHLLGLDHSPVLSATMFPTIGEGLSYARALSTDDVAGISSIYPAASFLSKGSISGTVRLTTNASVYGAVVVAVNAGGQPVASAVTDPRGFYTINGLDPGTYTIYAEPMDQPFSVSNAQTLLDIYPGVSVMTSFTTRFR